MKKFFSKVVFVFLMFNMFTSVFAIPVDISTVVEASDFIVLDDFAIDGGTDYVESEIPLIQMSGGSDVEITDLDVPVFSGGVDEVVSELSYKIISYGNDYVEGVVPQIVMAGGVDYETGEIPEVVLENEVPLKVFNMSSIELSEGSDGVRPTAELKFDTPYNGRGENILNIDGVEINILRTDTLSELVDLVSSQDYKDYNVWRDGNSVIFELLDIGLERNGEVLIASDLSYNVFINGPGIILERPSFSGGEDKSYATGSYDFYRVYRPGGDSNLSIDGVDFDLGDLDINTAGLADLIVSENGNFDSVSAEINPNDSSEVIFTSLILGDDGNGLVPILDGTYSNSNPGKAYDTITITDSLAEEAQDHEIIINGVTIDLGMGSLTPSEIGDILREEDPFEGIEAWDSGADVQFITESKTHEFDGELKIEDRYFTSVNSVPAISNTVKIVDSLAENAQDNELTIAGVTFNLGSQSLSPMGIAQVIGDQEYDNYTVFVDGANITFISKVGGVDISELVIDGTYSVENSDKASLQITVLGGLARDSEDSSIELFGDIIDLGSVELTTDEVSKKIYNEFSNLEYDILRNGSELIFTAVEPGEREILLGDNLDYTSINSERGFAVLEIYGSLGDNSNDRVLNIEDVAIDLGNLSLNPNDIASIIANNNFTNYTVFSDENLVIFESLSPGSFINGEELIASDLSYVSSNGLVAKSVINISDGIVLEPRDSSFEIYGIEYNFSEGNLSPVELAFQIKDKFDTENYFAYSNGSTIIFTAKNVGIDNTILNGFDSDYTSSNMDFASGVLTINDDLIEDGVDSNLEILGVSISLENISLTNIGLAQYISEIFNNNSENYVAQNIGDEVYFKSVYSGSEYNVEVGEFDDLIYGGKAQRSLINFGDIDPGYTYKFEINGDILNDISALENTGDFLDELVVLLNSYYEGFKFDLFGDKISVESYEIGTPFDMSVSYELNTAPSVFNVSVEGDLKIGNEVFCSYDYYDLENDLELTPEIEWFVNGEIVGNESSYVINNRDVENNIECSVKPISNYGVKEGEIVFSDSREIPYTILEISDESMFSIPVCVDSERMLQESDFNGEREFFATYSSGAWNSFDGEFEALRGYKYFGDKSFNLPVYIDNNCDFSEARIFVESDWNLIGSNSLSEESSGDFLWSLTRRSIFETYVDTIRDFEGNVLGLYDNFYGEPTFYDSDDNEVSVFPFESYWIFYAGKDDQMFNGVDGSFSFRE